MIHSVYFWLKTDLSEADRQLFASELALITRLPYLAAAWMGRPAPVEPRPVCDLSFDWNLVVQFKTVADHDFYQADCPDHKRFIETCKHLWSKVIIYDMSPEA
jgi:hypothetical protein